MAKFVGPTFDVGGVEATGSITPTASTHLANKAYVDSIVQSQLYKQTLPYTVFHQSKLHQVATGTFVPSSTSFALEIDCRATVHGNAQGVLVLFVGINGGASTTPLYASATGTGVYTAAAGVTGFFSEQAISLPGDLISAEHHRTVLTGLTAGTTYTWQLVGGMVGGAQSVSTVGTNPFYLTISADGGTVWTSNYGDNTIEHINTGWRAGWRIGITPTFSSSGTPIIAGTNPYGIAVSPDGQYLMVCNFTDKTVTTVHATQHRFIGTTTLSVTPYYPVFTPDSTVCWVACSDSLMRSFTINPNSAPTLNGTTYLVGTANDTLGIPFIHPDGKTMWVPDQTSQKIYYATMTSDTVLGTFTAATGTPASGPTVVTAPMTFGVAAGGTLTSGGNLTVTGVVGAFPPQSWTIYVPIAGGYQTVTYQYAVTTGTSTTFFNCTGFAGSITVTAANVVIDPGVYGLWGATTVDHISGTTHAQTLSQATSFANAQSIFVSSDGEELWIAGGSANQVEARQTSDFAINTAPVNLGNPVHGIVGSADGFIYMTITPASGRGSVSSWPGGTMVIDPTNVQFTGSLVVSGQSA